MPSGMSRPTSSKSSSGSAPTFQSFVIDLGENLICTGKSSPTVSWMASTISRGNLSRFSREPPYSSVRWLNFSVANWSKR